MINTVTIGGRLTTDPVCGKTSYNNTPYAYFTIACERPYKNTNGQREADYIKIMTYEYTATYVSRYFHKGDKVFVSGRLQSSSYENDQGVKVTSITVLASEVAMGTKAHKNEETNLSTPN